MGYFIGENGEDLLLALQDLSSSLMLSATAGLKLGM